MMDGFPMQESWFCDESDYILGMMHHNLCVKFEELAEFRVQFSITDDNEFPMPGNDANISGPEVQLSKSSGSEVL